MWACYQRKHTDAGLSVCTGRRLGPDVSENGSFKGLRYVASTCASSDKDIRKCFGLQMKARLKDFGIHGQGS